MCKNSKYLFVGRCYDNCAAFLGYRENGGGSFSRECRSACGSTAYDSTPLADAPTCIPYTVCTDSEYEQAPGTVTSDRQCTTLLKGVCGDLTSCKYNGRESAYRGTANSTLSGRTCQVMFRHRTALCRRLLAYILVAGLFLLLLFFPFHFFSFSLDCILLRDAPTHYFRLTFYRLGVRRHLTSTHARQLCFPMPGLGTTITVATLTVSLAPGATRWTQPSSGNSAMSAGSTLWCGPQPRRTPPAHPWVGPAAGSI